MTTVVMVEMLELEAGAEAEVPVEVGVAQEAEREVTAEVSAGAAELELVAVGPVVVVALVARLGVAVGHDVTVPQAVRQTSLGVDRGRGEVAQVAVRQTGYVFYYGFRNLNV